MLISKKDLLTETGISYGQLYRWKRQKLIPEVWFQKQATSTGQETFFEREKIIPRIQFILEHKDKYSMEELAAMLTPSLQRNEYRVSDLKTYTFLDQEVVEDYESITAQHTTHVSFREILFLTILSQWKKKLVIRRNDLETVLRSLKEWSSHIGEKEMNLTFIRKEQQPIFFLIEQNATWMTEIGLEIHARVDLDEKAKEVQKLLNDEMVRRG